MIFPATKKKGIVLIRLDAIGDFVIWSHAAAEYRQHYKNEKITLIANLIWSDLATQLPYWDEVWPIDSERFNKKILYRWSIIRKVSKAGFRIAIQPTYSRIMLKGDSIIRATCAEQRIGSVGDLSNITKLRKHIADGWYTKLVPSSLSLTELERNSDFSNHLFGISVSSQLRTFPRFTIQYEVWQEKIQKQYVILFPGASKPIRQWPVRRFSEIANELYLNYGFQSIVCGAANEEELCQKVCGEIKAGAINLAGKTSLPAFAELVRNARLLIGNETSAIHIAAAVNTPSVCITGGGHYGRFVPYPSNIIGIGPSVVVYPMSCFNCNWQCTQPHDPKGEAPCIENIIVEQVLKVALQIILQDVHAS